MITSLDYGEVRYFHMARTVFGRAPYWTGVYFVDGLLEPDRGWLFSGDLYLAPRLKYLRDDEDVHAMVDSLRRVVALEPRVLFCQHRGLVENGAAMLRRKLDFLVELGERIGGLRDRGLGEDEIAHTLPWSDLLWRIWTGGHFSKRNLVRAFLRPRDGRAA